MKILWVSIESPLPANSGGRQVVFNRLSYVSKKHDVFYFYPYDKDEDLLFLNQLKKMCMEVHCYKRKFEFLSFLKTIHFPYTVASRNIDKLKRDIELCVIKNKIDLINLDFPHMVTVVGDVAKKYNIPIVLNQHNIEHKVYESIAYSHKNILKKIAYFIDAKRLKRYEERITKTYEIAAVTFVSDKDLQYYRKWMQNCEIYLKHSPIGANLISKFFKYNTDNINKNIIFVGSMSYAPNIEGAIWFVKNVMPILRKKFTNVRFYIVGRNPVEKIKNLASDDVIVTGTVENVDDFYNIADLVVLPIFHGGGVKVKLLEGISRFNLVVSTTKGVEGTVFAINRILPIADDVGEFSRLCIERLANCESFNNERESLYKCFIDFYTWEAICNDYCSFLECIKDLHSSVGG